MDEHWTWIIWIWIIAAPVAATYALSGKDFQQAAGWARRSPDRRESDDTDA
jgi:hypothetical protein